MTTETVLPFNRDAVTAQSKTNGEPDWLRELRLEAMAAAARLEWPKLEKTRIDRWNLNDYGQYEDQKAVASLDQLPEEIRPFLPSEADAGLLVQRNSGVIYEYLSDELKRQGVIFTSLNQAFREHGDLLRKYFLKAVRMDENKITALHAAMWSGGLFLYVPRNVRVEVPLQAMFLSDRGSALFSPHILIVAEDNSSVTYVDNALSLDSSGSERVHNSVVEVFVKPGAKVQFASVHQLDRSFTDLSYRRALVENDGKIDWILGEMNDGNCMSDTTSILRGNGSASNTRVLCVGSAAQQLNLTTRAVHFGKSSDSDMVTRAVMRDEATAIINGITKIEHGATGANGEQTEKVMMLSPKARGDANPMLLIDEDEVTAGHAASVGQVDPNQIYYLMSRGISRQEAERLIIYGFLAPVVSSIPIGKLSEQLQTLVERKLQR